MDECIYPTFIVQNDCRGDFMSPKILARNILYSHKRDLNKYIFSMDIYRAMYRSLASLPHIFFKSQILPQKGGGYNKCIHLLDFSLVFTLAAASSTAAAFVLIGC